MKNDYQLFCELLDNIKKSNKKPTLLLHSCCGPCSSYVLEKLLPYFKITIFYYNPNIYPKEEFFKRLDTQKQLLKELNEDIDLIVKDDDHQVFLDAIKDTEYLKEGSKRCYLCYEFRIKKLSEVASKFNFDYFSTVMSVSPYKNSLWINELGKKYENNSLFLYSNFKKEEGYKKSIILSKEYHLYRQSWCGCEFSLKEHEEKIQNMKEN